MTIDIEREFSPEPLSVAPSRVAVLDMEGQYVGLLVRGIERQGVPVDLLPYDTPLEEIEGKYGGIVISGSHTNSFAADSIRPDPRIWTSGIPKLGVCAGMHEGVVVGGGVVERGAIRQDGVVETNVDEKHRLFAGTKREQKQRFTHGNFATQVPANFTVIAQHEMQNGDTCIAAVECEEFDFVGVQFHPECFDDAPDGYTILKNFVHDFAGLDSDPEFYDTLLDERIDKKKAEVKELVGDKPVIAYLSGGVDSAVAVKLLSEVIDPAQLHCFFFDTGYMRLEDEMVISMLEDAGINVERFDVSEYFAKATIERDGVTYGPLEDETDHKIKRLINGKAFIDLKHMLAYERGLEDAFLLMGTNAADAVESKHKIVIHHNRTEEALAEKRVEPLMDMFKDEIRAMGRKLGLSEEITERPPFPGPGTLIRLIDPQEGEMRETVDQEVQTYVEQFFADIDTGSSQLARVLPVKTSGVAGDEPTYLNAMALAPGLPWENVPKVVEKLTGKFRDDINRVIIPVDGLPLADYTITPRNHERDKLQSVHAHHIVYEEMKKWGVYGDVDQCPVILIPLSFDEEGKNSIVVRPVSTSTFMTVEAMLPENDLPIGFVDAVAHRIQTEVQGISRVFWDVTGKPPGRTEWQ